MTTFAIATDNNITAFTAAEQVPEGQDRFTTEKEFAKLSADWPLNRFPEVWNAFARMVHHLADPCSRQTSKPRQAGKVFHLTSPHHLFELERLRQHLCQARQLAGTGRRRLVAAQAARGRADGGPQSALDINCVVVLHGCDPLRAQGRKGA